MFLTGARRKQRFWDYPAIRKTHALIPSIGFAVGEVTKLQVSSAATMLEPLERT
jgi:hypothetical protein